MKVHVIDGNSGIVVMVMAVIRVAVMIRKQYLSDCLMVFMVLVLVVVLKVDVVAFLLSTTTTTTTTTATTRSVPRTHQHLRPQLVPPRRESGRLEEILL